MKQQLSGVRPNYLKSVSFFGVVCIMVFTGMGCGKSGGENPEVMQKKFPGVQAAQVGGSKAPITSDNSNTK